MRSSLIRCGMPKINEDAGGSVFIRTLDSTVLVRDAWIVARRAECTTRETRTGGTSPTMATVVRDEAYIERPHASALDGRLWEAYDFVFSKTKGKTGAVHFIYFSPWPLEIPGTDLRVSRCQWRVYSTGRPEAALDQSHH
jgi:hypothetical protein